MERRITIDEMDAQDLANALDLIINHSDLLDKEYRQDAYKFYGQIKEWIEVLRGNSKG